MVAILLHLNEAFFEKMKAHKIQLQAKLKTELTWELYVKHLFGIVEHGN